MQAILDSDWRKIFLTLVFIFLSYFYIYEPVIVDAYEAYRGLPLFYYSYFIGGLLPSDAVPPTPMAGFLYFNLILDIIFWYVISCFILWAYVKFSRK